MKLSGIIEINGIICHATMDIKEHGRARAYQAQNGKWRAYKTINGIQKAFGSHDTKEQALKAARMEIKPTRRGKAAGDATGLYVRPETGMCRVVLTIGGIRVKLGEYATWGHAVLVRDVVARRAGLVAHVVDYEMPLALVNNPVARSYIRDTVPTPTPDELARYTARVDELNRSRGVVTPPAAPRLDMLPAEMWRIKQPSVTGHRS